MSINNKQWLGLPLNLLWGYIAIAVFMTGDGFELAFLSHYIKALGFSPAEASFAFTLYGLAAALSAWISGVVAEIITPLKTMMIGFVLWCVFHVLFLVFGLGHANYALILIFYGIRGFAYPLFLYSFIVAIVHNVKSDNASSAIGWFWAVYSIGIGVFGSYIPSFTIPHIGELGTLWLALAFCVTGGVIALASCAIFKRRSICRISPLARNFPSWDAPRRCSIPTAIFCCRAWSGLSILSRCSVLRSLCR